MRILVVDDREVNRMLIKDVVEQSGHTAVLAENGREAWELLDRGGIGYIVSDKDMPEMSGVELLKLVRGDSRTAGIPFILMSGNRISSADQTPLEDVCAQFGATFLPKPFSIFRLIALLDVGMELTT